jgi:hypothetical protein
MDKMDFKSFDFSCDSQVKMLDVNSSGTGDVHKSFINFDPVVNLTLIKKMSELHGPITGPVSEWYIENSAKYPETTECISTSKLNKNK